MPRITLPLPLPGQDEGVPDATADPTFERAVARLGVTLKGKWRLDVLLGVGGTAAVYGATHRNGSKAAVKVLHEAMATNPLARQLFLREGEIANAVEHDGVIKILDDDTAEDGSLFLVTELLSGETLEERRVRLGGRIPPREVLLLSDRVLDVLAAAHARGIVHCDLKPENVFLTADGQVKVLDFGIARLCDFPADGGSAPTAVLRGTPDYMAPEQARGLSTELDARSDLWACGAMMFCLLSGRMVHDGQTVDEVLANAMTKRAPRLGTVAPDIGSDVAAIVDRALQFSRDMRWPDAARMQMAIRRVCHELEDGSTETAPTGRSAPRGPIRGAFVLIVAPAVAGFGLAWMVAGSHSPSPHLATLSAEPPPSAASALVVVRLQPIAPESMATIPPTVETETAAQKQAENKKNDLHSGHSARTDCLLPYVVDAQTGKRHWRLECL